MICRTAGLGDEIRPMKIDSGQINTEYSTLSGNAAHLATPARPTLWSLVLCKSRLVRESTKSDLRTVGSWQHSSISIKRIDWKIIPVHLYTCQWSLVAVSPIANAAERQS